MTIRTVTDSWTTTGAIAVALTPRDSKKTAADEVKAVAALETLASTAALLPLPPVSGMVSLDMTTESAWMISDKRHTGSTQLRAVRMRSISLAL